MSTRSGKRIHKSLHENMMNVSEEELEAAGGRKTRSRRLKANCDALNVSVPKLKKRVNYVSYPSTDDSGESVKDVPDPPRTLRKHTLKEITVETVESDKKPETKPEPTRLTRRTKKFAEEELPSSQEADPRPKKGMKNKKKIQAGNEDKEEQNEKENRIAEPAPKKAGKKKKSKKRASVEAKAMSPERPLSINNSATSVDSFHSAAESPMKRSPPKKLNGTFDKPVSTNLCCTLHLAEDVKHEAEKLLSKSPRRSSKKRNSIAIINDTTFDKCTPDKISNATVDNTDSLKKRVKSIEKTQESALESTEPCMSSKSRRESEEILDTTFDKSSKSETKLDSTFDKKDNEVNSNEVVNVTFDKSNENISKISITSDDSKASSEDIPNVNVTFDKSDENISKISITSDDSKASSENVLNETPVLIESSMETTLTPEAANHTASLAPLTPLKREGTFTKHSPDVLPSPKATKKTPIKRQMSMPSPGRTPYTSDSKAPSTRQKTLNLTHSLEKSNRKFSFTETRFTRVAFCSPAGTPAAGTPATDTQRKSRIIKSSIKGSNKTFVFQNSDGKESMGLASGRKRSLAQSEVATAVVMAPGAKRTRLDDELRRSVDRLSRPRTPGVAKSEVAASAGKATRSQLPNFAALHRKQFERMESLGECQQRRAKRARQLLAPSGPRGTPAEPPKSATVPNIDKKKDTPTKTKPDIKPPTDNSTYTRFGFKLNLDVNPFSIPSKVAEPKYPKPMLKRPNTVPRPTAAPSIAGATHSRQALREPPASAAAALAARRAASRTQTRTIIRGVRTNRRFELQMRSRNI